MTDYSALPNAFFEQFVFPNNRDGKGPLREAVLVRSPKGRGGGGAPFSHTSNSHRGIIPTGLYIYRPEADGATYLGGWAGAFIEAKKKRE